MQPYEKYPELKQLLDTATKNTTEANNALGMLMLKAEINKAIAPVTNSTIAMHLEQIVENLQETKDDWKGREINMHGRIDLIEIIDQLQKVIGTLKQLPD